MSDPQLWAQLEKSRQRNAALEAEVVYFKASYARKIDEVDALLKQLEALRAATQWRPIADAPRHGPWMPVWTGYPRGWAKGHWSVFAEAWTDEDGEEIRPTHYLSLIHI